MVSGFLPKQGELSKEVKEVNLHELTEESSITKTNDNGVSVVFNVVLKGKRKPVKKEFYVQYL